MTQTSNKLFDDFAKLLTNAAGAAQGVRREIDTVMRSQAERILNELDVVSREEFDAVRDMAAKAREENDALEQRIAVLEAKLGAKAKPAAKSKPAAKPARSRKAAKPGSAGKTS
jgi:BMFP domain-containing protein YqiC